MQNYIVQLLRDLQDEDEHIRFAAARTLSEVAGSEQAVIDALMKTSRDPVWFVRLAAVQTLEELNLRDSAVVKVMAERLSNAHEDIREWAAWSLGKLGPSARPFISVLMHLARKDPVFYVRLTATEALGRIAMLNDTEIIPILEQVSKDKYPEVRMTAANALSIIRNLPTNGDSCPLP